MEERGERHKSTEHAGGTEDWKCYTPEKRAQRLVLCYEENREGSLCPCCVDFKNFSGR